MKAENANALTSPRPSPLPLRERRRGRKQSGKAQINRKFYWLLRAVVNERRQRVWTVEKIADAIYTNRGHLSQVFRNEPKRGRHIRPKLVKFFKKEFPEDNQSSPHPDPLPSLGGSGEGIPIKVTWRMLLDALGWDEEGEIKPLESAKCQVPSVKILRQMSDMEHNVPRGT